MTDQNKLHSICKHFQGSPVEYCSVILGVSLSAEQQDILTSLTTPPYKTLVKSSNNYGKTFVAACAVMYAYDCFDPSIVITTSSTYKQVCDILFKEIRTLGHGREGFSPKAPNVYHHQNHQIIGQTSDNPTSFQGHHGQNVFIVADELVGIDGEMIEAMMAMLGGDHYFFLGTYNPTDQNSYAYSAERTGNFHKITLNALKHPNIIAELKEEVPPFPNAIRLERLRELISEWCEITSEPNEFDFEFEGKFWHPSSVAESRILGRWPTIANDAIFTQPLIDKCINLDVPDEGRLQMGVDVSCFGDDATVIAIRRGRNLLHMEMHYAFSPMQTAGRMKELHNEYHKKYNLKVSERFPCVVDSTGVGGAMKDMGEGYNFVMVNFASTAWRPDKFQRRRDEMFFEVQEAMKSGNLSLKHVSKSMQDELSRELIVPTYKLDINGKRVVEKKADTKKVLGRSPDAADALLLAFTKVHTDKIEIKPIVRPEKPRRPGLV